MRNQYRVINCALVIVSFLLTPNVFANDVAPYFFTWAYKNSYYDTTSLMQAKKQAGLSSATLAFAITKGYCQFNGAVTAMKSDISEFQAAGGRLIISFGGAAGTYIEKACTTDDSLFNAIDNLIQETNITNLDFDIEGSQLADKIIHERRTRVLARLQQKYPNMYLSYTLPVGISSGLSQDSLSVISMSVKNNIKINIINLMTMDYYTSVSGKTMGDLALISSENAVNQLMNIYTSKTRAGVYRMIGITPMIGTNDDHLVFYPSDAQKIVNYAKEKNIGFISYWGFQRDRTGGSDLNSYSLHNDYNYQYYDIFKSYLGEPAATVSAPETTTEPTTTETTTDVVASTEEATSPTRTKKRRGKKWQ